MHCQRKLVETHRFCDHTLLLHTYMQVIYSLAFSHATYSLLEPLL